MTRAPLCTLSLAGALALGGCAGDDASANADSESLSDPFGATGMTGTTGTTESTTGTAESTTGTAESTTGTTESTTQGSETTTTGDSTESGTSATEGTTQGTTEGTTGAEYCYEEILNPDAAIDDLVAVYGGADYKDQIIEIVGRRWPGGVKLLDDMRESPYFAQFSDESSWSNTATELDFLTHEMTHLFNHDYAWDNGYEHALYMHKDKIMPLPDDSAGFPRSEVLGGLSQSIIDNEQYLDTYFTGEQGERTINALLDELSCYTVELAISSIYAESFDGFGISLRDGSVAFLHFLQVYLRIARTQHPDYYQAMKSEDQLVEAVRDSWLRVHLYLPIADEYPSLGISDDLFRAELYKPDNVAEIELFIGAKVGESNCLQ